MARKSALSLKASEKAIVVIEDFKMDTPKTQDFRAILTALNIADKKSLFVTSDLNKNVYLSSRNLTNSKVVVNSELNTYAIMNTNALVLCESAIAGIETNLSK